LIDSWVVDTILSRVYCPQVFSVTPVDEVPSSVDIFYSAVIVFDLNEVSIIFCKEYRCPFDMFW
jgi:hypothetical protein